MNLFKSNLKIQRLKQSIIKANYVSQDFTGFIEQIHCNLSANYMPFMNEWSDIEFVTFEGILPTLNSALNPFMYLMFNSQLYCMQVYIDLLFLDPKSNDRYLPLNAAH